MHPTADTVSDLVDDLGHLVSGHGAGCSPEGGPSGSIRTRAAWVLAECRTGGGRR
ncbi:hypothetical protein DB31_2644 [Hyalangium minutum]|uniref:Uncharacterized protein n=1 Tax=Hyalangium minutum TaxID=394096 RepID=A0A085W763_9BACT|nr:hypothetical protein DB31_2644 [Hyalangium minutum]